MGFEIPHDHVVVQHVLDGEYGDLDFRDKVVVDIGAHIGAFTHIALEGGARQVHAFEPSRRNFEWLRRNCGTHPNALLYPLAVGPRGQSKVFLQTKRRDKPSLHHTGEGGAAFEATDLDSILRMVGDVDLLKIDCEGSEYGILGSARRLRQVQRIVGELHQFSECHDPEALKERLREQGYAVRSRPGGSKLTQLFSAS